MIRYEVLETGTPKDIRAYTDDTNGEIDKFMNLFDDLEYESGESPTRDSFDMAMPNDDGGIEFIISGGEAGELAEMIFGIDDGQLDKLMDELNRKAINP